MPQTAPDRETISRLELQAFRGIATTFSLALDGRSAAIFGENGTGKSTLVDALEWYFTSRIEYLSRENRQDAIRHAGAPTDLETKVSVETSGELGGAATLIRSAPRSAIELGDRETFILRGRTLAAFIDKTKGQKWQELMDILGLEGPEQLRQDLYRARHLSRDVLSSSSAELTESNGALRPYVEAGLQISERTVLAAIRRACTQASIAPPDSIDVALDDEWRRSLPDVGDIGPDADIQSHLRQLRGLPNQRQPVVSSIEAWNRQVDHETPRNHSHLRLYEEARAIIDRDTVSDCPLCGQAVDPRVFGSHVRATVKAMQEANRVLTDARSNAIQALNNVSHGARRRQEIRTRFQRHTFDIPELPVNISPARQRDIERGARVDVDEVVSYVAALERWDELVFDLVGNRTESSHDDERSSLVNLGALLSLVAGWKSRQSALAQSERAAQVAAQVYDAYSRRFAHYVESVLERISDLVATTYTSLHPHGGIGKTTIGLWGKKGIELQVDYHGITHRPPNRVLSESHLNSLGIALFLTMARVFNVGAGFVVLDDVVNSFDIEHRAALAAVLTEEFDDLQLLVFTHDPTFYNHLTRSAPSWRKLELLGWTYAEGPRICPASADSMLSDAMHAYDDDDRTGSSQKARRALEELLREACEKLEAPVPFRRGIKNELRDATELIKGLRRVVGKMPNPHRSTLKKLFDDLETDLQVALNVEVHANDMYASRAEVKDALSHIRDLYGLWTCTECSTRVWHLGHVGGYRCKCGESTYPP